MNRHGHRSIDAGGEAPALGREDEQNNFSGRLRQPASSGPVVFLVDDDASVRRALTRLIKSARHVVRAFASASEFLKHWSETDEGPACLVLDVRMPGLGGLELQHELQAARALLPIIFITGHGDVPMGVKAMKDGAVDFLPKPVKDTELLTAIEQALAKSRHDRAERLERDNIQKRVNSLTQREREVMALVVRGLLNKQIAFELGTVEKTIKVHRARVMEKMAAHSLADLVRIAERAMIPAGKDQKIGIVQ